MSNENQLETISALLEEINVLRQEKNKLLQELNMVKNNGQIEIVLNRCYGGFSLSQKAIERYAELTNQKPDDFYDREIPRHDPSLIQVVKELGKEANGPCADLEIVKVHARPLYEIDDHDGRESLY